MKIFNKITAVALAAATMISLTACGEDTAVIGTSGGKDISAGVYLYNAVMAYTSVSTTTTEEQPDVWAATMDGKTAEQYIRDEADNETKKLIAIENKFDEMGLALSDIQLSNIEAQVDSYFSDAESAANFAKMGIGRDSYSRTITGLYKKQAIFDAYYGEGGIEEVKDSELKAQMKKEYSRIKYIAFNLKDSDGNLLKGAEKQNEIDRAKDYADRATKDNFDELMYENYNFMSKKSADAAGKEYTPLEYKPEEIAEYSTEAIIYNGYSGLSATAVSQIMSNSTRNNTVTLIEEDEVCYVVLKLDILEREDIYEGGKETLLSEMKTEEFETLIDGWTAEVQIEWDQKAYDRYAPKKMKLL